MVILISGASHTGKTLLAQRMLEDYKFPYLSIDHLKMGMIRSGQTELTVFDDEKMTGYLWPILREIIKTAVENGQNLILEGCYIPFSWRDSFAEEYRAQIRHRCLVMSRQYIETHFEDIRNHANAVEQRLDDSGLDREALIRENQRNLEQCCRFGCEYILIDGVYAVEWKL